ncbi:MAG: hypothetical protein ACFFA0_10045 [Promethearchaeota archaeon]
MKSINTKSLMVFTILFASFGSMPIVVNGEGKGINTSFNFDQVDPSVFSGFQKGFGSLFGENLGYAGALLGTVFETLFLQGLDLNSHETLKNVYVLSANTTRTIAGSRTFLPGNNKEYYYFPADYEIPANQGFAYCEVTKSGGYTFELEIGAAVTLVIWDNDRSFITAVNKLLDLFNEVMYYEDVLDQELPVDLIRKGIEVLTWFLIHINDIFTGDELFILNPITWQKMNIIPSGYTIDKTYWMSGLDYTIGGGDDTLVTDIDPLYIADWTNNATTRNDIYVQWLLTPTLPGDLITTLWTQFSFDLIQLWIKNFEIHIDVAEILNAATGGGTGTPEQMMASAFGGCDIEFYLFTHHLAGAFLYEDTIPDEKISASYVTILDNLGDPVLDSYGDPVQIPESSELTHRIVLTDVENFIFNKPTINSGDRSISWGITFSNANISAVPIFVDLDSYLGAQEEMLEYIYFGFTFIPTTDPDLGVAKGLIKLDQNFAPWNGGTGPNGNIAGLDLAIIYVSTILHFHLNVALEEKPDEPEVLLKEEDYINSTNELKVGNYISDEASQKLDFVDIAGPFYKYGSDNATAPQYNASTNILPLVLWKWEVDRHDTFTLQNGSTSQTFASDIRINTSFNVMIYAVCYPVFDGTALGVWHDPTFSVYMVFQSEGFWALIVLIAGVGLVGVATVLIKRRKDSRF